MYMYNGTIIGDIDSVLGTCIPSYYKLQRVGIFVMPCFENLLLRCSYLVLLNNDAPL